MDGYRFIIVHPVVVVIGGLITATMLTLFVLPSLYLKLLRMDCPQPL